MPSEVNRVDRINPYAPVEITDPHQVIPIDAASLVEFELTSSQLRKAEEQFLLRNYVVRLSVGSITMIFLSLVAMGYAIPHGELAFFSAAVGSMTVSAVAYLALIHRPKMLLRSRLADLGVQVGAVCSVRMDTDDLVFTSPAGTFRWPYRSLKTFRNHKGILLWNEPLMFAYVPRSARFFDEDYHSFCKRLIDRTRR